MTIKLLALDLDGTVVRHDLTISDKVMSAIQRAMTQGVKVVVATGRMHQSALPFVQALGTPEPVISYQGGMIRHHHDSAETMFHKAIDKTIAQQVIDFLRAEKVNTNLYVNDVLYVDPSNTFAEEYSRLAGVTPTMVDDITAHLDDNPTKLVAINDERIEVLAEELNRLFGHSLGVCLSRKNFCEMINPQTSKWHAVNYLAKQYGFFPDEIMAIGDQENDLPMIKHAGIGVAMGEAPAHVKAIANVVTASVGNDGVYSAIQRFVLDGERLNEPALV